MAVSLINSSIDSVFGKWLHVTTRAEDIARLMPRFEVVISLVAYASRRKRTTTTMLGVLKRSQFSR
jgi:hypothetical protein